MRFFDDNSMYSGPPLSSEMVGRAQANLGVRLPDAYIEVLHERNGGIPVRRCFRTTRRTSWAEDHVEISALLGLGFDRGIDGELGSACLIQEWGYPDIGVVICDTPSGGHDTVMLDYRECGPEGEPRVAYVDEDRSILLLAQNFAEFVAGLLDCDELQNSKG
ncbi:SMI1/KNR4 family protein [Sorangium sp. So ce119]|uniref:SMI1/KNR4 family protein n=1 Tax=Sorangium sp. So ce119 TaxID=3133279 RepID=UPI003F611E5E